MKLEDLAKVILGLIIIIGGLYLLIYWWPHFFNVLRGILGPIIILIGLVIFVLGISELRS